MGFLSFGQRKAARRRLDQMVAVVYICPQNAIGATMKRAINTVLGLAGYAVARTDTISKMETELADARREIAILREKFDRQGPGTLRIYGHHMRHDPIDPGMNLQSLNGREHPSGEEAYICRALHGGQIAVDIGANVGLITLLMARAVGRSGRVFAFEPGPRAFRFLQMNVELNGYEHIVLENVAVCDRVGQADLQVCLGGESDNRLSGVEADENQYARVRVKTTTIDQYLRGQRVDLIKMDIQGSEFVALKGMRETAAANPGLQIITEYGPGWLQAANVSPNDFFNLIGSMRFDIFDLSEDGEERHVDREWLASNVGGGTRSQTNLILRRAAA